MKQVNSFPSRSPLQQSILKPAQSNLPRPSTSQITYLTHQPTLQTFDSYLQQSPVGQQVLTVARPFFKPDEDLLKYSDASSRQVDPVRYASSISAWQPTYRRVHSISTFRTEGYGGSSEGQPGHQRPHSIERMSTSHQQGQTWTTPIELIPTDPSHRGLPVETGQINIVTDPVVFASGGTGSGSHTKAAKYITRVDSPNSNKKHSYEIDKEVQESNRHVKAFSLANSGRKLQPKLDEEAHRQSVAEAERRVRQELQGKLEEAEKNWKNMLTTCLVDADSKAIEICNAVLEEATKRFEEELVQKDIEMQKLREIHHEECNQLQSMLDHWKDQCCRKEHDIHFEKEHHRVLKIENELAKSDITTLQMRIKDDSYRSEINVNSNKDKIKSLEDEIKHLSVLNQQTTMRLEKMTESFDQSTKFIAQLQTEHEGQLSKNLKIESKIKELTQEKETLMAGINSQEETIREMQNELLQKSTSISDLESEIDQYRNDLRSAEHKNSELLELFSSDAQGKDRHLNKFAAEIEDLKQEKAKQREAVDSLEAELSKRNEELEQIYLDQTDQLSKIEELEARVRSFMKEVEVSNTEKESLKIKVDKLETDLATKGGAREPGLSATISQLKSELIQKQQENADLNEFIYKLERELQDTEDTIKSLEHEIRERGEHESLNEDRKYASNKSDQQEKFKIFEDEIERCRDVCQELELKNGYLEDRVKRLQSDLDREREVIGKECQRELLITKRELQETRQELEGYEKQAEEISTVLQTKENELVQLATFCKSLQNELLMVRPVSRNAKKLEAENKDLLMALDQVEKDFEEFRNAVEWREHQLLMDKERAEDEAKCKKAECEDALYKNGQLISRLSQAYSEIEKNSTSKSTLGQRSHKQWKAGN